MRSKKQIKIGIVEDDIYYNKLLTKYVRTICSSSFYPSVEFDISSFTTAEDCFEEMDNGMDILILDYFLQNNESDDNLNGADLFYAFKHHYPHCKVIMISAMKDVGIATELIKDGLYAYVDKNLNSRDRIGAILQNVINEKMNLRR